MSKDHTTNSPCHVNAPLLLNTSEAAIYLRLSVSTLARMRLDSSGPAFIKTGAGKRSAVLYSIVDIQAWLKKSTFQNTSQYSNH